MNAVMRFENYCCHDLLTPASLPEFAFSYLEKQCVQRDLTEKNIKNKITNLFLYDHVKASI